MALSKITYNNKANYQTSSLADEYKVSASDMNEIKSVVNDLVDEVESVNSSLISANTTATGVISTSAHQTIYSTTLNKGTYLSINNISVNFYGESSRDMVIALYVNNTEVTRTNAVINTSAYTFPVVVNRILEIANDNTPFRIDVWSSVANKNYVVNSSPIQILKLK